MEEVDVGRDFNRKTILVVDDEESIVDLLVYHLQKEGYDTLQAYDGASAVEIALKEKPDLILLDVMLPKMDGISVCKRIRYSLNVPILMISAKDTELDKVVGLEMGADDYITKPFSLMVLISKVNALMRRTSLREESKRIIRCRNLSFYPEEMKLLINNEEVILSKNEYKLLNCLIKNSGQIVTKGQLLEELWDKDGAFVDENTVAVNIRRLREKIEDIPSEPVFIKNIRGIGYRWNEEIS